MWIKALEFIDNKRCLVISPPHILKFVKLWSVLTIVSVKSLANVLVLLDGRKNFQSLNFLISSTLMKAWYRNIVYVIGLNYISMGISTVLFQRKEKSMLSKNSLYWWKNVRHTRSLFLKVTTFTCEQPVAQTHFHKFSKEKKFPLPPSILLLLQIFPAKLLW